MPWTVAQRASWSRSVPYASHVRCAEPRRRRSASSSARASFQAGLGCGCGMGLFFIDTSTGRVATQHQLIDAGIAPEDAMPPRPWLRIQSTRDASTMWYAVLRRKERGVYIGTLALRHTSHHASLLERGWEEIPFDEIAVQATSRRADLENRG